MFRRSASGWFPNELSCSLTAGLLLAQAACNGTEAGSPTCSTANQQEAIFGGSKRSVLALTRDQEAALVSLVDSSGLAVCSGTLIDDQFVLTAAHCALEGLLVRADWSGVNDRPIRAYHLHPTLDVAVAELAEPIEPTTVTLGVARGGLDSGQAAVIAGYGVTDTLELGQRRFAAVDITETDAASYSTTAYGLGGSCIGDSGGPLLWRNSEGAVSVFGVLSGGDASCLGTDVFSRLDNDAWVLSFAAGLSTDLDCDTLPAHGACFRENLASWCEGSRGVQQKCAAQQHCGWSALQDGYRCIEASSGSKPCNDLGHCEGSTAVRCEDGQEHRVECGAVCGSRCVRYPSDGRVACSD